MLLDIKIQKNGTFIITAPDQTIYSFKVEEGKSEKLFSEVGETVLRIMNDPQPEMTTVPTRGAPGARLGDPGGLEGALRNAMDTVFPGSSVLLDKMQDASTPGEDEPDGATG